MPWLATVVAIALVAFLLATLRSGSCKSFICLSILLVPPLVLLVLCVAVFQPLGLLTYIVYECLSSNNLIADLSIRQEQGSKLHEFIREAFEYCILVLFLCDVDSGCC